MTDNVRFSRRLPVDLPAKARAELTARLEAEDALAGEEAEARSRKAEEIVARAQRQTRNLLGRATYDALRQTMRQESLAVRKAMQPPGGLKLDLRKAHAARKRKADALLRRAGIKTEELRRIGLKHRAALSDVFVPGGKIVPGYHTESHVREWHALSPNNAVAYPWVIDTSNDPHRWLVFTPPFMADDRGFVEYTSGDAQVHGFNGPHAPSGLVANEKITLEIEDAGDFNHAAADSYSAVLLWFAAPATGVVEVLIDAQNLNADHYLETENEWGWSDSITDQESYLMMKLHHPSSPDPSYALMSHMSVDTAGDNTTRETTLNRGQHYFARLFSSGIVQKDELVYLSIGGRTFDVTISDDVGILSETTFRWFIKSVQARISP